MKSARRELLEVQKRLVRRIKREIVASIGPISPEMAQYRKEYDREFARYRLSSKEELREALRKSDVVFVADYHTLRHSQLALIKILEELLNEEKEIVLCLETIHIEHQKFLDAFMRGDIGDDDFLRLTEYEDNWGFPWSHYRPIFEFARSRNIRLAGINSTPSTGGKRLVERDRRAAAVVAGEMLANPDAVVVVQDGDLHIAKRHLPEEVNRVLGADSKRFKSIRIFQNSEKIYWRMAERGEDEVDVVRLRKDSFCVMSSTPLVKYQSYLNWEANREELSPVVTSNWMLSEQKSLNYAEQIHYLIRTIADFFDIDEEGLDDFQLYTTGDLDFLHKMREDHSFTEKEIQDITVQILKGESYFIPRGHIIYLGNLSISHAAEEVTHFIDHQCTGDFEGPMELRHAFYYRVMREAVGWLGSKIINPKRWCFKEKDYTDFLEQAAGKKLPPKLKEIKRICRYVVQHKKMERKLFKSLLSKREGEIAAPSLKKIFTLPMNLHIGVSHALGYMLGEKLYYALRAGVVRIEEMRALFYEKYDEPRRPYEIYVQYAFRTRDIPDR